MIQSHEAKRNAINELPNFIQSVEDTYPSMLQEINHRINQASLQANFKTYFIIQEDERSGTNILAKYLKCHGYQVEIKSCVNADTLEISW
jgi:hypothetical protein